MEPVADAALTARYTRRHPEAEDYLALGDFSLWRLAVERAHLVAGFGAVRRLAGREATIPPAPALAAAEAGIVERMNARHARALATLAGADGPDAGVWTMTGMDPEGLDIRGPGGLRRANFGCRAETPADARRAVARLVREARRRAVRRSLSGRPGAG